MYVLKILKIILNVCNNIFIDTFHEFIWPDLDNNYYNEFGKCLGLRDHIGILSDGTIIPCCLDSRGVINLGNIYKDNIDDIYNSKIATVKTLTDERKARYYDEAVETAFHIYRHWFQFTVPKAFRVVDSIQRLICEKRNIKPGSYSFFVQQLENDFIRENLSILVEFGIPSNAVRRLENVIPSNLSEDEVIDFIKKNRSNIKKYLLPYESERLEQCI